MTEQQIEQPLPCPFCGSTETRQQIAHVQGHGDSSNFAVLGCAKCPAQVRYCYAGLGARAQLTVEEGRFRAAAAWNRRAPQ